MTIEQKQDQQEQQEQAQMSPMQARVLSAVSGKTTEDGRFVERPYKKLGQWFAVAVGLQLTVLATMSSASALVVATGTRVQLHVQPVDPNDMFRGDYLNLRYDVSNVKTKAALVTGDTVYVVLKKGAPYATAESLETTKPAGLDADHLILRGKVVSDNDDTANIVYGFERAYIPENTGSSFNTGHGFSAQVAIDGNGNSVLCGVKP